MATPTKRPAKRVIPRQIDEDDEEETPRRRPQPVPHDEADVDDDDEPKVVRPKLRRGMSAGKAVMDSTSSFAQAFKLEERMQVIKFLEDEPYANYTRHWVEVQTAQGRGQRSYTCLKSFDRECPLCEAGDRAQAVSAFNIALIGDDGVPLLKTWDCGPKLFNILLGYASDPKVAPLTKGYFLTSKTGKRGSTNYHVNPVKAHSLEEDYEIIPPTKEELAKLGLYDESIVQMPKTKELEELAAVIADEY